MNTDQPVIRQFWNGFVWSGAYEYIYMRDGKVALAEGCCCPCPECDLDLTITATYCGMTATTTFPIPGFGNNIVVDGDNYLDLTASIVCGPCGWYIAVLICRGCEGVQNSEGHFGEILNPTNCTGAVCPSAGPVAICCDALSECLVTVTASLA